MATLTRLCDKGALVALDPGLEDHELPQRLLYASPEFIRWLDEKLPELAGDTIDADMTPLEQVYDVLHSFVVGDRFDNDRRFKKLTCNPENYIWEIKTDDVRIFGWVPRKDTFICCFGESKVNLVVYKSVERYKAQSIYFRNHLDLDEPKTLQSVRYEDVLSN